MPCLVINTNVADTKEDEAEFMKAVSKSVADTLGKAETWMQVQVSLP